MGETHLTDEASIVELAKTDEQAFRTLYDFYFPKIYAFVFKRMGHREITEDIVSHVFMNAFLHLADYKRQSCPFGAWLHRIATNKMIDAWRKHPIREIDLDAEAAAGLADPNQNPLLSVEQKEDAARVRAILGKIPKRYQRVLVIKFYSELSNTEIAATLGISPNNVGVLVYRSLKAFHKAYSAYVPQ